MGIHVRLFSRKLLTVPWYHGTRMAKTERRWASSTKRNHFQLDALPFSISPSTAQETFFLWAHQRQGLEYLLQRDVKISAVYAPVWSFDLNIRLFDTKTGKLASSKPKPLDIYTTDTIHIPGWAVYSGYTFRRSLIDLVHRSTLLYMGNLTIPFNSSTMLKGLQFDDHSRSSIEIFPDPWNTTRGSAIRVLEAGLEEDSVQGIRVETEVLNSRRVYMPTYVIEYRVLGLAFEAFLSGCDPYSPVSGVSHVTMSNTFASSTKEASDFIQSEFIRNIVSKTRLEGLATVALTLINYFLKFAIKVLARFHIIGIVGGAGFITFRKLIKPWMDSKTASAEWERQRLHEAQMHEHGERDYTSHFKDDGGAMRYFYQNKTRILNHFRGRKEEDSESIYDKWWQYVKSQTQQQQTSYQKSRQTTGAQQEREREQKGSGHQQSRDESDFNDPYRVLSIKRGATMSEISQAFRREMLKNHPDTKPNASEEERQVMTERSKIITDAYRKLKAKT